MFVTNTMSARTTATVQRQMTNPYVIANTEAYRTRLISTLLTTLRRQRNLVLVIFAAQQNQLSAYLDYVEKLSLWFDRMYCLAANEIPCYLSDTNALIILNSYLREMTMVQKKFNVVKLWITRLSNEKTVQFKVWQNQINNMKILANAKQYVLLNDTENPDCQDIRSPKCQATFLSYNLIGSSGAVSNVATLKKDFANWQSKMLDVLNKNQNKIACIKTLTKTNINDVIKRVPKSVATVVAHIKSVSCERLVYFAALPETVFNPYFYTEPYELTWCSLEDMIQNIMNAEIIYYIVMVSPSKFLHFQYAAQQVKFQTPANAPDGGPPPDADFPRNKLNVNECRFIGQQTASYAFQRLQVFNIRRRQQQQ